MAFWNRYANVTCMRDYKTSRLTDLLHFYSQIPLVSNEGKKGLGCNDGTASIPKDTKSSLKTAIWTKAQERYNEVSQKKIQNIFANSSDSE